MMFPFISKRQVEKIGENADAAVALRDRISALAKPVEGKLQDFPARLTAYDSATGYYSWTRRQHNQGTRINQIAGYTGTPTRDPAKTPNGEVIDVTSPVDVWLRPVGFHATVGMVHEIIGPQSAASDGLTLIATYDSSTTTSIPSGVQTIVSVAGLTSGDYLLFGRVFYSRTTGSGTLGDITSVTATSVGSSSIPGSYNSTSYKESGVVGNGNVHTIATYLQATTGFNVTILTTFASGGFINQTVSWQLALFML